MNNSVKQVAVLGSTGSIGQQALQVIQAFPQRFHVVALSASENINLLRQQIEKFKPKFVFYRTRETLLTDYHYDFLPIEEIARHTEVDVVVAATSGNSGLVPVLAAVRAGKDVALANKESLVMAGEIILAEAKASGARLLPVDSEHSAIWQCLNGEVQPPAKIILTASGGPFLHYSAGQMKEVTPEQALKHPSWQMGKKVTVDSATLMNKGLEVIEAHWLFGVPFEDIQVVIQPQSIIHSMVEFIDGSVKAQLSQPDMRLPIQYALTYPERLNNEQLPRLDFSQLNRLTFEAPDLATFPCLNLAIEAGKKGSTYPAVLSAADEIAVAHFLSGQIRFTDIPLLVSEVLEKHRATSSPDIDDILAADAWARQASHKLMGTIRAH